jgi:Uma2 family endonuclease
MALAALEPARVLPITPTAEVWSSMSADARDAFLVQVLDALNDPNAVMGEGRPHWLAKSRVLDAMSLHFDALKRVIYLAEELPLLYPGERPFVPDVLAVLDVPQSEDDERLGWVVAQEGRGLDWVLEVLHRGDRKKDLVENVERYAHLGIPEYFVYDRENQQVLGYRLSQRGSGRYLRIVPQLGRVPSAVLGLDLAVVGGKLQLFHGMAEVFGTGQLLGRLRGMMSDLEVRASEADGRALQADGRALQADGRASQAEDALREAILALLEARGIDMPESARDTLRNLPRVTGW